MRAIRPPRMQVVLMLVGLLAVAWAWPTIAAQSADQDRRLHNLESIGAERRLAVLENRLDNIETVGKGILIAVAAQLLLSGLQMRPRGRREG